MSVQQAFNQASENYDQWVRKALPGFEELFGNAMIALPFSDEEPIRVLDLGAGTGLFSSFILPRFPKARFVLVDLAENMLAVARKRFEAYPSQFDYSVADVRAIDFQDEFDLAISSLAIHHLEHADKQSLFRQIQLSLKPGGIFLNIDQINAPDEMLRAHYWDSWLHHVRSQGATQEQIEQSIERRRAYDHDAGLVDQLSWLDAAGFARVDILYKNLFIGLFFAQKGR